MSYQVLARKWRPQNFVELAGQDHVLQALMNALTQQRLHHAYLFTGTRGVGKTTIARIFAKCLNCETNGISPEPCGTCPSCVEIAEGRFVDLIEVDAASRTKVEDTRELLENVQYAPTRGRFKVYLIDEVHMLSTHSFNALLKTLEEPPPHVKFLLATTDPQKLPVTILSRCLQFNLKNMSAARVVDYLKKILSIEQVEFEDAALWQIGQAADGSMRDALSLTDQAISFGNGFIRESDVTSMLGLVNHAQIVSLLECIVTNDAAKVLQKVADLAEYQPDFIAICGSLLDLLHRVAIEQQVPGALEDQFGDLAQVKQLAANLTSETVQLFYQNLLIGKRDLPLAHSIKAGFEMLLLRLIAFRPAASVNISSAPVAQEETSGEHYSYQAEGVGYEEKKTLADEPVASHSSESQKTDQSIESPTEKKTLNTDSASFEEEVKENVEEVKIDSVVDGKTESVTENESIEVEADAESEVVEPEKTDESESTIESEKTSEPQTTAKPAAPVKFAPPTPKAKQETVVASESKSVNQALEQEVSRVTKESEPVKPTVEAPIVSKPSSSTPSLESVQDDSIEEELDDEDELDAGESLEVQSKTEDLMALVSAEEPEQQEPEVDVTQAEVIAKNGADGVYSGEQIIAQPALGMPVETLEDFSELTMQQWWLIAPRLPLRGLVHNILMNSSLLEVSPQGIKLEVPLEYGHMLNQTRYEQIQNVISQYFDQSIPLIIDTVESVSGITAEEFAASKRAEAMQAAVTHLNDHPIVKELANALGGQLVYESVKIKA